MNEQQLNKRCEELVLALRARAAQARIVANLPTTRPHDAEDLQLRAYETETAARIAQAHLLHGVDVPLSMYQCRISDAIKREIVEELSTRGEIWPDHATAMRIAAEVVEATFQRWAK